MSDYFKVDFSISPYISDAADLLAAFLADEGYESFSDLPDGLSAYVTAALFDENILEKVAETFPMDVKLSWTSQLIPHKDWNEEWEKNYFKPKTLARGRCVVHSSFHTDYPKADVDILVDPKMAFGTGNHDTTAMMVEFLFELDLKGKKVLDMGTGTGILAIIAMKLGAASALGIEIDPDAYENALENVSRNNADVLLLNGDASLLQGLKDVDIFLTNINRNIILNDLHQYVESLSPQGTLLLSGFYSSDIPVLDVALEANGMKIAEKKISQPSGWAALRVTRL